MWLNYFQQTFQGNSTEKGRFSDKMVLEQLDIHMENNEAQHLSQTTHKNLFKMNHQPKCET